MSDDQFVPEEGFTYVVIETPDKGITLSGAMDNASLSKIIDIATSAEIDRKHTRPAPAHGDVLELFAEVEMSLKVALVPPCGVGLAYITNAACAEKDIDELRRRTQFGWDRQYEDLKKLSGAISKLGAALSVQPVQEVAAFEKLKRYPPQSEAIVEYRDSETAIYDSGFNAGIDAAIQLQRQQDAQKGGEE